MKINRYIFCWFLCFITLKGFTQDANYWGNQYGPGGFFMPGTVVANNSDSGVLFVNPALLANSKITSLSANATIYHADKINIKNGAGTGFDLKSKALGSIPALVAGNFHLPIKNKNITIAYGLIQPPAFSFATSQRRDEKFNVLNDSYSPGPETFVGQYIEENNSSDFKMLIAAGWKVAEQFSMGITLEGNRHTQTIDDQYYAKVLVNTDSSSTFPVAGVEASYYVDYATIGLIPKLGFAWSGRHSHAGLMITSPIIDFGGKATLLSDNTINNIDLTATGDYPISFFADTRQEDLAAHWKSPLSIAGGFIQDLNKWQLYVAAEYFNKIKEYNIITPRKEFFIRPDTGNTNLFTPDLLKLKDVRKAVLNAAIGIKYAANEKYNFYFSLRTDNTWYDEKANADSAYGITPNSSMWDIYHFQVGLNFKKQKFNLRGGFYGSYGNTSKYKTGLNFDNPAEINLLQGTPVLTKATYFSIGFMLSYLHNF